MPGSGDWSFSWLFRQECICIGFSTYASSLHPGLDVEKLRFELMDFAKAVLMCSKPTLSDILVFSYNNSNLFMSCSVSFVSLLSSRVISFVFVPKTNFALFILLHQSSTFSGVYSFRVRSQGKLVSVLLAIFDFPLFRSYLFVLLKANFFGVLADSSYRFFWDSLISWITNNCA